MSFEAALVRWHSPRSAPTCKTKRRKIVNAISRIIDKEEPPNDGAAFSYDELPEADRRRLRGVADQINERVTRTVENLRAIGERLLEAREILGPRKFAPWFRDELGMAKSSVYNCIRLIEKWEVIRPFIGRITPTVLFRLCEGTATSEVFDEVARRAEAGEKVTVKIVNELIRKAASGEPAGRDYQVAPQPPPILVAAAVQADAHVCAEPVGEPTAIAETAPADKALETPAESLSVSDTEATAD